MLLLQRKTVALPSGDGASSTSKSTLSAAAVDGQHPENN
jgi:hypothetical protein